MLVAFSLELNHKIVKKFYFTQNNKETLTLKNKLNF